MKAYETPNVEIIAFTSADIITSSNGEDVLAGNDDTVTTPGSWWKR